MATGSGETGMSDNTRFLLLWRIQQGGYIAFPPDSVDHVHLKEVYEERVVKERQQAPTTKQRYSAEKHPYLLSHKAVLKLNNTCSAYTISFCLVSANTKQQFFELFDERHCASSLGTHMSK